MVCVRAVHQDQLPRPWLAPIPAMCLATLSQPVPVLTHVFAPLPLLSLLPQVGPTDHVICALSGGVDSTVAATLVHKVLGDRLHCVFVDNGLLRWVGGGRARFGGVGARGEREGLLLFMLQQITFYIADGHCFQSCFSRRAIG